VEGGYTWQDARGQSAYRLPGPENLGWWVAVAVALAILVHVALFIALGRIYVHFGLGQPDEIQTGVVNLEQVEVMQDSWDDTAPRDEIEPPPEDAASLLEDVDLLEQLPEDTEIDIRPDIKEPEISLKLENPAMSGELEGDLPDAKPVSKIDTDIADFGKMEESLDIAAEGQVIVDPGKVSSELIDPDAFNDELIKKGAEGVSDKGVMKDFTSLDDMIGLKGNALLDKKAMIGSDLLFDYNSDQLRESARLSLMKVAMLIDRNPNLYCWIEGHTDLFGGDQFNLELSRRRAAAVKAYLVESLRLPPDKIVVRGYGKSRPIVPGGSIEAQALNRRVEIKMRKQRGADDPVVVHPKRALPVESAPKPAPTRDPKPLRVEPKTEPAPVVPRAQPVKPPSPPKAEPVAPPPAPRRPLRTAPDLVRKAPMCASAFVVRRLRRFRWAEDGGAAVFSKEIPAGFSIRLPSPTG